MAFLASCCVWSLEKWYFSYIIEGRKIL
jgi:hypothetical protein